MAELKLSAVTIPTLQTTFFVVNLTLATLPASVASLVDKIDEDVRLVVPDDLYAWPDGAEAPEPAILCRSRDDLKHYRVFKQLKDVDPTKFDPTSMTYGGVYSESHWERFVDDFPQILRFLQVPDEDQPGMLEEVLAISKRDY